MRRLVPFLVCLACLACPARPLFAQSGEDVIYRYTDKRGVIHLSNRRLDENYQPFHYLQIPKSADQKKVMAFVRYHCRRHRIDPELVRAVIEVESGFKINALSPKGAAGLMQIMPDTGRELELADPMDPALNIEAGIRYLKAMLDKFGDVSLALAAYNAGPGRVSRDGGVPSIDETQRYVREVLKRYGGM